MHRCTMDIISFHIDVNAIAVDVKQRIKIVMLVVQVATLIQLKVQKNYWKVHSLKL